MAIVETASAFVPSETNAVSAAPPRPEVFSAQLNGLHEPSFPQATPVELPDFPPFPGLERNYRADDPGRREVAGDGPWGIIQALVEDYAAVTNNDRPDIAYSDTKGAVIKRERIERLSERLGLSMDPETRKKQIEQLEEVLVQHGALPDTALIAQRRGPELGYGPGNPPPATVKESRMIVFTPLVRVPTSDERFHLGEDS